MGTGQDRPAPASLQRKPTHGPWVRLHWVERYRPAEVDLRRVGRRPAVVPQRVPRLRRRAIAGAPGRPRTPASCHRGGTGRPINALHPKRASPMSHGRGSWEGQVITGWRSGALPPGGRIGSSCRECPVCRGAAAWPGTLAPGQPRRLRAADELPSIQRSRTHGTWVRFRWSEAGAGRSCPSTGGTLGWFLRRQSGRWVSLSFRLCWFRPESSCRGGAPAGSRMIVESPDGMPSEDSTKAGLPILWVPAADRFALNARFVRRGAGGVASDLPMSRTSPARSKNLSPPFAKRRTSTWRAATCCVRETVSGASPDWQRPSDG